MSKRDCVSDCVVPSCSSVQCAASETCVLSSQTCSQCPTVSCVSLSVTNLPGDHKTSIPKGAIAGIIIAVLLLLAGSLFLAWVIRQRRRNSQEAIEKAPTSGDEKDLEIFQSDESYRDSAGPSHASIQICLSPNLVQELDQSGGCLSNTPVLGEHFFSADELLRMSYADSRSSLATTVDTAHKNDTGAAIMQANKPVTAVRAKAAVLQFVKTPTVLSDTDADRALSGRSQVTSDRRITSQSPLASFWDDSESVLASPIERDLISPSKFSSTGSGMKSDSSTPTKSKSHGRSLTGDEDPPVLARTWTSDSQESTTPTFHTTQTRSSQLSQ